MNFRKADLQDLPQLNDLLRRSKGHWGYDKGFMDTFMALYSITPAYLNSANIYIAEQQGQMIAFYSFSEHTGGTVELDYFFLEPSLMGRGLGQKLWQTCLETAREKGLVEFNLWSDPNSEAFYVKRGCQNIGSRQSPIVADRFAPVMKYVMEKG